MNIAGFFRTTKLTFVSKTHEHDDIYTFHFSHKTPIDHTAGQHALFILPGLKGIHIFSLSSAPEEELVAITTHVRPDSSYKEYLNGMERGDIITMRGPVLDFVFKPDASNYVFLAQGIGVTPFRSLLVHADQAKLPVVTRLIHVDSGQHAFRAQTELLASRAEYVSSSDEFTIAVTKTINADALYYLSGNPKFIKSTKRTLTGAGIKSSHIKTDAFLGY